MAFVTASPSRKKLEYPTSALGHGNFVVVDSSLPGPELRMTETSEAT
ncbi:hypothetical protein PI125_g2612 [Phytophthora idaei]|nr:hypothetical protein PI125_g2612 [Phytophthora idaei]